MLASPLGGGFLRTERVVSMTHFHMFVIVALGVFGAALHTDRTPFVSVNSWELASAQGGACEDCFAAMGTCTAATKCQANKNGNGSVQYQGTFVTPIRCKQADPDGATCTNSNHMACYTETHCSDANCMVNCGTPQGKGSEPTKCSLSGTVCVVGG